MNDPSTLQMVGMIIAGYTAVTIPLMLATGRILRVRSQHIPVPEHGADMGGYPPASHRTELS
jgi:hypothetical protein